MPVVVVAPAGEVDAPDKGVDPVDNDGLHVVRVDTRDVRSVRDHRYIAVQGLEVALGGGRVQVQPDGRLVVPGLRGERFFFFIKLHT
jgi:hypothetical protein